MFSRFMESSSESEEEKKKSQSPIKQQKSARLGSSSSSDEGVDDPWPSTRPPSDTDQTTCVFSRKTKQHCKTTTMLTQEHNSFVKCIAL